MTDASNNPDNPEAAKGPDSERSGRSRQIHLGEPRDRGDELLADPPTDEDYHLGRFAGYRRAGRVRRNMTIAGLGVTVIAVVAGSYYASYLQQKAQRVPYLQLPPGSDLENRPRTITWSSGQVRLGMHREPPGVTAIDLPDRILHLAEESRSAQVKVKVVDGKTEQVVVLFGKVIEELKPGADSAPP